MKFTSKFLSSELKSVNCRMLRCSEQLIGTIELLSEVSVDHWDLV